MNARELVELREKVKDHMRLKRELNLGELSEIRDALTTLINMEGEGILEP